ncbi:hypothetical protein APHAL10511_000009 [Amanita phalloides]|nr:hypothetical protein APHAL10511_000009 [Amanita phalloides]
MGSQLSVRKRQRQHVPRDIPHPVSTYWPVGAPVIPPGYTHGFVPSTLPWPVSQQTHKRRRKQSHRKSGRKRHHRSATEPVVNFPAGFVPNGFVPNESMRMQQPQPQPQPVIPSAMGRAASQGQPPPLFTPGPNNSQHLTSFPSPQIPVATAPSGRSSQGHGPGRRAPTPFIPPQSHDDDEDEEDEDSDNSADSGPVIPGMPGPPAGGQSHSQRGHGHRSTASVPQPMLFYVPPPMPRRPNPLPEPPKILFDRTPFKRLVDLPVSAPPYLATLVTTPPQGNPVSPDAGTAGIAGIGANGANKKKPRFLRAFSLRGSNNRQAGPSAHANGILLPVNVVQAGTSTSTASGSGSAPAVSAPAMAPATANTSTNTNTSSSSAAAATTTTTATTATTASSSSSNNNNPTHSHSGATVTPSGSTATPQPPIRFSTASGPFSILSLRAPCPIQYRGKSYPTALHLYEARRYIDEWPESAEAIRTAGVRDVVRTSGRFQTEKKGRADWGRVYMDTMDQHPSVRTLLVLETGHAPLVFADDDFYWGDGPDGRGENELGKALMRVRDRWRALGVAG